VAVRSSTNDEILTRASTLNAPLTVCGYNYLTTDRNAWSTIFNYVADDGIFCIDDGTQLGFWGPSGAATFTGAVATVGTWFFWAMSWTTGTSANAYFGNVGATSLVTQAVTSSNVDSASWRFLDDPYDEWWDGRVANIRVYSAALTATELLHEAQLLRPVRGSNLWAWWPLYSHTDLVDYSGNGRDLSSSGTLTTEDGPNVTYGASPLWVVGQVAGGGPTHTLTADAGSYSISGQTTTLRVSRKLTLDAGSYAITGRDAALRAGRKLAADAGSYSITGQTATLLVSRILELDAGSYSLSGQDASLLVSRLLDADAGSYTLTGLDVTLTYTAEDGPDYTLTLDAGSYTLTGQTANLIVSRLLDVDAGAYALTGQDASLLVGRILTADVGSYTLTGQDATLLISRLMATTVGSYSISGLPVTLVYSGAIQPVTPASRVIVVPAEDRVFVIVAENRVFALEEEDRVLVVN
jgi:hypothetical protein